MDQQVISCLTGVYALRALDIAKAIRVPKGDVNRELYDMLRKGIVIRVNEGMPGAPLWSLNQFT